MIKKFKHLIQRLKLQRQFNEEIDECRFPPPSLLNIDYHYPQYKILLSQAEIDILQVCINNRLNLQELIEYGNGKRV